MCVCTHCSFYIFYMMDFKSTLCRITIYWCLCSKPHKTGYSQLSIRLAMEVQILLLESTSATWRHICNYPCNKATFISVINYVPRRAYVWGGGRRFSTRPNWGKWPVSCSDRFTGGGRTLDSWIDGVGSEPVWIHWSRQQLCPWLKLNPQPSRCWIRRTTALIITRILF